MPNNCSLLGLFVAKGIAKDRAIEVLRRLKCDCPWLSSEEEVSEEIGSDLIRAALDSDILRVVSVDELIACHNASARRSREVGVDRAGAYHSLRVLIAGFGIESAFGDGDYWVVSDSFSTERVCVVKFGRPIVPSDLECALRTWLNSQDDIWAVSVSTEEGEVIFSVER
jgi:hypothetical protein